MSLICIYGIVGDEQIVLEMNIEVPIKVHKSRAPTWPYGEIRGGCVIKHNGKLLRFFHSHSRGEDRDGFIYYIGAAIMEPSPPFPTVQVSSKPILVGNEKWTIQCPHWKQNVVFPAGVTKSGDIFKLAFGSNDCSCEVASLRYADLNL